ncbi:hypothetical protein TWF481_012029 [Arthrobotrys musiformis]|uniref:Uncharacterized protein n=1 Tax=Arthrobotrys musiformis TaxID=47236 RepID=A0AAV9W1Y2_9PEZI
MHNNYSSFCDLFPLKSPAYSPPAKWILGPMQCSPPSCIFFCGPLKQTFVEDLVIFREGLEEAVKPLSTRTCIDNQLGMFSWTASPLILSSDLAQENSLDGFLCHISVPVLHHFTKAAIAVPAAFALPPSTVWQSAG